MAYLSNITRPTLRKNARPRPLLLHTLPTTRVRIVFGERIGDLQRVGPEISVVYAAVLVDDEGHDSRTAPFFREGDQRVARDHVAVDDVIVFSAGSMLPLALQNPEVVTMIRRARQS